MEVKLGTEVLTGFAPGGLHCPLAWHPHSPHCAFENAHAQPSALPEPVLRPWEERRPLLVYCTLQQQGGCREHLLISGTQMTD